MHDSLFSKQRIHVLPHNFLLLFYVKKKNLLAEKCEFFMVLQTINRSIYFFGDRLFTCYHLSIHYVLSNQSTLELVMKAENLKGNKIQAVIEYTNGTRSKIGRTAQKKSLIHLNYKS